MLCFCRRRYANRDKHGRRFYLKDLPIHIYIYTYIHIYIYTYIHLYIYTDYARCTVLYNYSPLPFLCGVCSMHRFFIRIHIFSARSMLDASFTLLTWRMLDASPFFFVNVTSSMLDATLHQQIKKTNKQTKTQVAISCSQLLGGVRSSAWIQRMTCRKMLIFFASLKSCRLGGRRGTLLFA